MKASRELDVLISEKIMGNDVFSIGGNPQVEGLQEANEKNESRNLPHYSKNLIYAHEAVDQMVKKGFTVSLNIYPADQRWLKKQSDGSWELRQAQPNELFQCNVSYRHPDLGLDVLISVADCISDTLAHAICLSAIQSKNFVETNFGAAK